MTYLHNYNPSGKTTRIMSVFALLIFAMSMNAQESRVFVKTSSHCKPRLEANGMRRR